MKEIKLTQGKVALVDDEDFEYLNQYKWYASQGYAKRRGNIMIHQQLGFYEGDHLDGNGLNNQKYNLRFCTSAQNNMNRQKRNNCKSKYKGVSRQKHGIKWIAYINGKYIGSYDIEEQAALAYNHKAKELFGEFARLNDIKEN